MKQYKHCVTLFMLSYPEIILQPIPYGNDKLKPRENLYIIREIKEEGQTRVRF